MLKPYYLKIYAVRITRQNFKRLKVLDIGDGVLECGIEECEGDWFVDGTNGYELMPGNTTLLQLSSRVIRSLKNK